MNRVGLLPARLPTARTALALLLGGTLAASGIGLSHWSGSEKDEAESALARMQRQHAQLATETAQLRQQQPALQAALVHWKTLAARGVLVSCGHSMASSMFLTINPSSVSPVISSSRLKNSVSGSSWRASICR